MRALGQNLGLVREAGFEPAWCGPPNASRASASTYSAIPAQLGTGRDRRRPTTASSYFASMFGGLARTFSQRQAISLIGIGTTLLCWSGVGSLAAIRPQKLRTKEKGPNLRFHADSGLSRSVPNMSNDLKAIRNSYISQRAI